MKGNALKGSEELKAVLWIVFMICFSNLFAQDDYCGEPENKKVVKLLNQASDVNKYDSDERIEILLSSTEVDENCATCYLYLAREYYRFENNRINTIDQALKNYQKVAELCPDFHADVYYYIGLISYTNQEYELALDALNNFIEFAPEKGKIAADHKKKIADVESILPQIKFYAEFYKNAVEFNPVVVEGVSSPTADEYLPMLSPDNELMFYTRKYQKKERGDLYAREVEEFTVSDREDYTSPFSSGEPLEAPFNVGDNYGGVSLSLNNREMFITVCKPGANGYNNCDIYSTTWEEESTGNNEKKFNWSGLDNLGPAVNTPDGWEAQPTLSADGNTLYFATVRENSTPDKDGNPSIDIYSSSRNAEGEWSQAKSIGRDINTDGNDKSPFLHNDSRTMYFSSNGRIGAGGYDLFFSKQNEDGSWSEPENLGYPINSPEDEHGLIVSTNGKEAFYASNAIKSSANFDVYSFSLPKKARPEKILFLKGEVRDVEGQVVENARVELKYTKSKEVQTISVNSDNGGYAAVINIDKGEDVVMSVKSEDEILAFNSRVFTLADTVMPVQNLKLNVESLNINKAYKINDIRYATSSSDINEESKRILEEFADYLKENPTIKIEIAGHTDNVGSTESNLALSSDRAFEVMGYLQELGIKGNRIKFKGYGPTKPIADNSSESGRAENRRTEFIILSK